MTPADLQIPERGSAPVVEDPAITAAKEEEAAKAAWLALPADTLTDEKTPKYKAAVKRLTKAENAFADAPITSIAGATIKLRALGKDLPEDGAAAYATGHVKTVLAFLEGFTGASSVVDHDHLDAALVALSRELVEAKAEEDRAVGKTDDALKAYHAAADRPEKPAQVEIKYRTGGGYTTSELKSVEAIQGFREHVLGDCIDPIEVVTARLDAALGEWRKYEAEDKKVSDRVGLTERWTEQEAASDRREKIEHQIIATRPETAVGLVVLVKLLAWYQEIGPEFTDHRERDLGRNILAAFERLTPGLAEIGWGPVTTPDPAVVTGKKAGAPPEGDDDVIEPTGIVLVDLPAKDIARDLADNSWADRARFFNNALVESLDTMGEAVEALGKKKEKPDTKEFLDICMIAMHGRIGEVLDIWGPEAPPDKDAAQLFALSGSPEHRTAAYVFCGSSQDAVDRLFKPANGLTVFKRMSELCRPGLNELWREHIKGKKREGAAS